MRFLPYNPDQAYLLPPSVRDVPGERHLCVFVHEVVERLDLSAFEQDYEEEGRPAYAPALRVKVWRYAYALGITSCRRAGTTGARGPGVPLPGRRGATRLLDAERLSPAPSQSPDIC